MEGFITKSIGGIYYVLATNNITYSCKAVGKFRNNNITPLVGDNVIFSYDENANFALIEEILPRKNELVRPPISNVDVALIVMSTIKPNFDSYLVDKLITTAHMQNIEPILLVSKCEFITDEIESLINNYKLAGYKVICFSSHENINIDMILPEIKNKKVVLCGQSAVGKSTLINRLFNDNTRSIGDYSEKLGRGKHETREVAYLNVHDSFIADTPGFSRLDIKVDLPTFARMFKDFEHYANSCKYSTCLHKDEPGCAVKDAVEKGIIDVRRYNNYLHLMNEIKDGKKVWRKK